MAKKKADDFDGGESSEATMTVEITKKIDDLIYQKKMIARDQEAFKEALGDKKGICRYGTCHLPMDETLAFVSLDISGRPYLVYEVGEMAPMIGDYDSELTEEFLRAFAVQAGITLHARILYGKNSHHKVEGLFKALAHALADAVKTDARIQGVFSTKGVL